MDKAAYPSYNKYGNDLLLTKPMMEWYVYCNSQCHNLNNLLLHNISLTHAAIGFNDRNFVCDFDIISRGMMHPQYLKWSKFCTTHA